MKYVLPLKILIMTIMASFANADDWDIDFSYGVGLSEKPVDTYHYTNGSSNELKAGDGVSFLLGRELAHLGPAKINLKGGFTWGSQSHTQEGLIASNHFVYFPVYLNGQLNLDRNFSIGGGLSYLIKPRHIINRNSNKATLNMASSAGYNVEIKYMATPKIENPKVLPGIYFRFSSNQTSYTTARVNNLADASLQGDLDVDITVARIGVIFEF